MGRCRNALDIACRAVAERNRFTDRVCRRAPQFVHVPLDMAGLWNELRDAAAGHRERRPVNIEDDGLRDRQATIDPEQTRHSHLPR
jgi:hypothetical protein